jgi:hypothetical protein
MEEEYQEKLNTYGNDSMVFVKDCTSTTMKVNAIQSLKMTMLK